ncbi:MAG: beta-L-arabinofuranosidase domain-containing protein [Capsulimonas sp.]|uniref:beta-L-arabinofuranosidase domain-containing protein n=1 Tax=Capsulimonas sp. TaxID=2494211 RepID=UPI003267DF7B
MKRRDFLKLGLATAGGAALAGYSSKDTQSATNGVKSVAVAGTDQAGGFYTPNRAPLAPSVFLKLPVGAVKPRGWLRHQLDLEVNGVCGRYPEVSDFLKYEGNGWVDPNADDGWEEVTYWLRGLADLGYVTGDARVTALANKWITGMIASQQPDGWFGPRRARTGLDGDPDFWPHMPALYAIRSYHEVTGDPKVIPFLTKFFQFQSKQRPETFGKSWAGVRWGDNIDSIYWLYNRTGDAFLIDLVKMIHERSADWTNTIASLHNVNFAQGFREPAQYGVIAQDGKFLSATKQRYAEVMGEFGQMAGGGFAGDENARHGYGDPRQGFETCGIAEYMLSFQILTRQTGEPIWMDRCEELAFNMLPASYDPEQKSLHYITTMNCVQIDNDNKTHQQYQNNFAMLAFQPGVHNYRCCPHNYGMAWPYYAENLWHATADKGLAANLYAASDVTAKVGDGTSITIAQTTEYPFGDTIHLAIKSPKTVSFPLYLRIPRWCSNATVRVNGKPLAAKAAPNSYLIVDREWKNNDTVALHLPMKVSVRTWTKNKNSVSVDRGPITYSLAIGEQWEKYAGTDQWPEYSVLPQTPWNYGLVLDKSNPAHSFDVAQKGGPVAANPFTHETSPIHLRVKAKKIPNWIADSEKVVTPLQMSPVKSEEPTETVTLIPMAAARLRITSFPTIGGGADAHEWLTPVLPDTIASASHVNDSLDALSDNMEPKQSYDMGVPRFTWWDHTGTQEWAQYDFRKPKTISTASAYWFDDTGHGECRVPKSWRLLYKDGASWKPVTGASAYGVAPDKYNTVTFTPITTSALRLEVQLQDKVSGGLLEWKVG